MNRIRLLSLLACALSATSCTYRYTSYWGRNGVDQPVPVPRDDPVWIWTSDGQEKWHAVVITRDSVSGIPFQLSVRCDSCLRSIPRSRVDSMRIGHKPSTMENVKDTGEFVGFLALITLLEGVVCYLVDKGDPQC